MIDKNLKISTNLEYVFGTYLTKCFGDLFNFKFFSLFNFIKNYKTETTYKRSVTGTLIPKFYTQSFLKYISGVIQTKDNKTVIMKQNYTINQLLNYYHQI